MATLSVALTFRKRWFFGVAYFAALSALRLGLVRDVADGGYSGGVKPAAQRAADWLVRNCMVLSAH